MTGFALGLMLWGAWAQSEAPASGPTLQEISSSTLPGGKVQIKLGLSAPPPAPLSFTIDNPARIVLDFADTAQGLAKSSQTVGLGAVRSVSVASAQGRTRVVVNLDKLVPYETRSEGNDIYLTLDASGVEAVASAAKAAAPAAVAAMAAKHSLSNIDFRRGEKGEARIVVSLSDPATGVDVRQEGGKIIADFLNTSVPESLERRLDVVDFATPVKIVETSRQGANTRLAITAQGEYEHLAYQADNIFTIEVKPVTKTEQEVAEKKKAGYTGERLSLNFQDIPVRSVLQLIADFTGQNLVTSDKVTGNLTLRLQNVPWDQALDIILKSKGLSLRQAGNVMEVAPIEEVAAREKLELEARKQVVELAPLRSEFIHVNYAKAADLAALLKAKENSLLSPRGNVSVDDRSNTLLVQDTDDKLAEVRKLVSTLDIPQRQVLIESRIVIADNLFSKDLGIRFGANRDTSSDATNGRKVITSGTLEGTTELNRNAAIGNTGDTNPVLIQSERLNVNLPVTGPSIALALAKLPFGTLLELELSALQAENRGEVISNPRVVTVNQKEATIEDGVEIPYLEASSSGATTVSFRKAVLGLKVKPLITPDNHIIMDLTVKRDTQGDSVNLAGNLYPSINTREVSTQVAVDNGETVVLGGTYTATSRTISDRVPFFGDLPYVGFLFKRTQNQDDKAELLIFVTPKILQDTLGLAQ
ncbi:MAG: type IV pilus secretin PilQ [Gammaproteobacteria bacterium]|nr:type IV pilus secretin PilQ [Gammaproteobacteria bacterium]